MDSKPVQLSRRDRHKKPDAKSKSGLRGPYFGRQESGAVVPIFALMTVSILVLAGIAIDFARWADARSKTTSAIDAAVLLAGRALETGASAQRAAEIARTNYRQNSGNRISVRDEGVDFAISSDRTSVSAIGSAHIESYFLKLIGFATLPVFTASDSFQATTVQRGANGVYREVSLMLDRSASMRAYMDDVKEGAGDLVNILIKDNPGQYWTKIALVPFSSGVRLPDGLYESTTPAASGQWPAERNDRPGGPWIRTRCVGERHGAEKHTDAPASSATSFLSPFYASALNNQADRQCPLGNGNAMPMTQDKASLIAAINQLTHGGNTAGQVGTAWSYYMLSIRWAHHFPVESRPVAFGTAGVKKIAILMTDGRYITAFDNNGYSEAPDITGELPLGANGVTPPEQAIAICRAMKQSGIEVFTIGFNLSGDEIAIDTLRQCATDAAHQYLPTGGEELKAAFRDIALKLSDLHLSR